MKTFFLLVKTMFINGLRPNKTKTKKSSYIAAYIFLGIFYVMIMASLISGLVFLAPLMQKNNLLAELILIVYIMGTGIIIIFGVVSLLTYIYFNKDAEFVASLPVTPGKVFLAKLTIVYLYELLAFAAIVVPPLVTIGIVTSQGILYYFSQILAFLLIPAFPLAFASIIAIPLMYVVSFFKNKGTMTTIFLMLLYGVFFGLYFYGTFKLQTGLGNTTDNFEQYIPKFRAALKGITTAFYPLYTFACLAAKKEVFGQTVFISGLINLAISVLSLAVLLIIAYLISNKVYQKGAISQNENVKNTIGTANYEVKSALKSLMLKDFKEITRTSAFGFQCLTGIIMLPLVLFFIKFSFGSNLSSEGGSGMTEQFEAVINIAMGFGMMLMLGSGMNITASTAITREGKNFYLSKVIPVDYYTQVKAKLYLSLIINYITIIISYILVIFLYKLGPIEIIFFPISLLLYSYGFAAAALRFDLKSPKLDWNSPSEAVKNNKNASIPTLINMAVSFIVLILLGAIYALIYFFGAQLNDGIAILIKVAAWILISGISFAFAAISRTRLIGSVNKFYEEIET